VRLTRRRTPTLAAFVEEWWSLYAEPNLERATRALTIARFSAELEADGIGTESIRKTLTLLSSVFSRAVEWGIVDANPIRATRKPPAARARAVPVIAPLAVEVMRADLRAQGRDPILLVLLAYAGLRPGEALALEWRHVRHRTLLIEQAVSDGEVKALKNRRRPRAVRLLTPLQDDLEPRRRRAGPVVARADGGIWRETDWRNWRRRVFRPAATRAGLTGARPYDLRHAFASLLIAEGRLSIVEIAAQLGHSPAVCLDIYGHAIAERWPGETSSAEALITQARQSIAAANPGGIRVIP
jgi:integrase